MDMDMDKQDELVNLFKVSGEANLMKGKWQKLLPLTCLSISRFSLNLAKFDKWTILLYVYILAPYEMYIWHLVKKISRRKLVHITQMWTRHAGLKQTQTNVPYVQKVVCLAFAYVANEAVFYWYSLVARIILLFQRGKIYVHIIMIANIFFVEVPTPNG